VAEEFFLSEPRTIEETGLSLLFLGELALKTLYVAGQMSGFELAQAMRLPFPGLVSRVIDFLKREHYCETRGAAAIGEGSYQYSVTEKGGAKAREVLWRNQYAGPAPVPLAEYRRAVRAQGAPQADVRREDLQQALSHLVVSAGMLDELGPAVVSRHSLLLYGASGNGKTAVARALASLLCSGCVWVPYAVEAGGEIILLYDDALHEPASGDPAPQNGEGPARPARPDNRWVRIRRPTIVLGAEVRLESMNPFFDELSRCYVAPPQVKANNGVVIVDDLGRQATPAPELLNRWMIPLGTRSDYLTLRTGQKLEVPFEGILIFATHLSLAGLADEALLRRIRHKVELRSPSFDEYRDIFRRACDARGILYDDKSLAYLLQKYYVQPKVPLRASHPDEILSRLADIAQFQQKHPSLSQDLLDLACRTYFAQVLERRQRTKADVEPIE